MEYKTGQHVVYMQKKAVIIRHVSDSMYEIRLSSGDTVVSSLHLKPYEDVEIGSITLSHDEIYRQRDVSLKYTCPTGGMYGETEQVECEIDYDKAVQIITLLKNAFGI